MKTHPFLITGICALVVGAMPQPARALPFAPNCGSFVSWMNTQKFSTPTKFSGPGTPVFSDNKNTFWCDNVYITETSPMGTRVCKGHISYNFPPPFMYGARWDAVNSNCRWK